MNRPIDSAATDLQHEWDNDPRWEGIERTYSAADVIRLRGSIPRDTGTAQRAAARLWTLLRERDYVQALGTMTGGQAVQMVKAGLEALYLSGWQVAGDANLAGEVYPDQSLYPANSGPALVRRINNALRRADEIEWSEGDVTRDWMVPIIADAEAGFGGALNAFELAKSYIDAGAAGVHYEDQLASAKKCGHMGGKVLVPTSQHVQTLNAARLAADVMGAATIVVARTDSLGADLLLSDIDPADAGYIEGERTSEGYFRV
jgi:isocitrate lyase